MYLVYYISWRIIILVNNPEKRNPDWCLRGPGRVRWWATREGWVAIRAETWAWTATVRGGLSASPSALLPSPCRPVGTSGTGRTDIGSAVVCPLGSFCPPDTRTWNPFARSSWKILRHGHNVRYPTPSKGDTTGLLINRINIIQGTWVRA